VRALTPQRRSASNQAKKGAGHREFASAARLPSPESGRVRRAYERTRTLDETALALRLW
jgi:hypothetical protein